jgi:2'-5' RNA ligase
MRLFVAVDLPPALKEAIRQLQNPLRHLAGGVSWVRGEGFHCTLKFLGEVTPEQLPAIQSSLAAVPRPAPFTLHLRHLGVFPSESRPRVIWVGLEPALPHLAALQRDVEAAMAPLGFPPENRPFRPHLTLGRVKDNRSLHNLLKYIREESERVDLGAFPVTQFTLFQSTLSPEGAQYTVLGQFALQG